MKNRILAAACAAALIALAPCAFAQTAGTGAANGAQYGDPNNSMAEGSQNTNGALSGADPGAVVSGSDETRTYNGADFDQSTNGAMSLQSNGSLNGESNLANNPPGTR